MCTSPATTPPASPTSDSPHDRNNQKCHTLQEDAPGADDPSGTDMYGQRTTGADNRVLVGKAVNSLNNYDTRAGTDWRRQRIPFDREAVGRIGCDTYLFDAVF